MNFTPQVILAKKKIQPRSKEMSFKLIYLFSTIFAFQTLLNSYVSSSYLEQFISPKLVGVIYAIGAAGAMILTLALPRVLKIIGNVNTILIVLVLTFISLIFVGLAISPLITVVIFTLLMIIKPQIYLNIDIFLETLIGDDETITGSKRGIILTFMSIAAFLSPIAMIFIVGEENNLSNVYFVSSFITLILIGFILTHFRNFKDPVYTTIKLKDLIKSVISDVDIKIVLYAQFLLQFFYTWAVIYIPLYLSTVIGLDWSTIGQIIAIGLFAFVLLQYPAGILADKRYGEKEMMAIGFAFIAVASASISFVGAIGVIGWMILIFCTRIGASLVEITTESYFFKHVHQDDSNIISLFRLMRPSASLLGAITGTVTLLFLPFNLIFVILGLIMVTGIIAAMRLNDTK